MKKAARVFDGSQGALCAGTQLVLLALASAGLLAGCLGSSVPGSDGSMGTASGGADTGASGGAASGGTAASGSGGAESSPTGGTSSGGAVTAAEWAALTAPIPGPHEIWTRDSCDEPHTGSTSVLVGQEYSVIPAVGTAFDIETNVYNEVVVDYCLSSADCTDYPGGVCQGVITDAYCRYSDPPPPDLCATDSDCTKKADGSCVLPVGPYEHTVCDPTGTCREPSGTCTYAGDTPCTSDADCTEGADGTCIFPVEGTFCQYDTCFEDGDCALDERCGCGECVEAGCFADEECGAGETCSMNPSFCFVHRSFHCTTPADDCEPGEDHCFYEPYGDSGTWTTDACVLK